MIQSEIFYLFSIISIGYILGNIKIRGFSLDITAMLIVALIAGHYGMVISDEFKFFGLAIFIYAVGLQSGPGFFETIKKDGVRLNFLAVLLVSTIFITIFSIGTYLEMPKGTIEGIFTGSLTSVPALASALEVSNDSSISVIFGLVYPFCIIITVLFVRILPVIFRVDLNKEIEKYEQDQRQKYPDVFTKNYKIINNNFKNSSIDKQQIEDMTGAIIERIEYTSDEDNLLHVNDIVRASGTTKELKKLEIILGEEINDTFEFHDDMKVYRLLVASENIVGKKIGQLTQLKTLRTIIAKVRRSGIDITPDPSLTLRLGDKLYVVAPKEYGERVTKIIGDDLLKYPAADFLPISLGIVLGILVGSIPFVIPGLGSIKLSFVGGILLTAILLGRKGRIGPIVWQLSPHSTSMMKTLGQLIFMATIGTNAGKDLVESILQNGFTPVYVAIIGLLFSITIITILCRIILKMNFINILGLLSGAMVSTPTLTMVNSTTKSEYPSISYAAVYPMSLVLMIILAQLGMKIL
ncbi:MAG: YidE/YbjL duplication [Sulfurospirillum sp.]|nr:YidE/YbjL duplication [Sulfurospirillum sp.]MBL0703050.1 YidE/YbjL duplication [Sulfurospirillum sp.]